MVLRHCWKGLILRRATPVQLAKPQKTRMADLDEMTRFPQAPVVVPIDRPGLSRSRRPALRVLSAGRIRWGMS
jgi:hypothetical protein